MRILNVASAGLVLLGIAGSAAADEFSVCEHGDSDARPVKRAPPPYPGPAVLFCIEGHAKFEFTIGADGVPRDVSTLTSVPEGVFDATGRVIESWRYEPRCIDGEPVEHREETLIEFELEGVDSERCPENFPDDLLAALVAITTLEVELTQTVNSGKAALEPLSIESALPPPYADIERAYRRYFSQRIEREKKWRSLSWRLAKWLLHPGAMNRDDWHEYASTALKDWIALRIPVRQQWPEIVESFREELTELADSADLSPMARDLLIDNKLTSLESSLEGHAEVVRLESELYDRYRALIDWLGERQQDWAVEAGELRFASDALEIEHARRREEIRQLQKEWHQEFVLPNRIFWSGL